MKLQACKIRMDDILCIYEDGTSSTIPSLNVSFIRIEKDFFSNFLPILNIKALVTRDQYKKINSGVTKFKISIDKFYIDSEHTEYNKDDYTTMYSKFISDVFINVNNNDSSIDPTEEIAKNTNQNDYEKANIEIDLMLFTEGGLNYRKLNGQIFEKCSIVDAIIGLAQITDQGKLLFSYPDNQYFYNNSIIIPYNLTFIGGIKFLQTVYGIYNKGYILFRDYDVTYLIDKSINCNAYRNGEFKRVYISYDELTKAEGNIYGQYRDNANMRYVVNTIHSPIISTNGTSENELLFDNMHVINTTTGKSTVKNINMVKSSSNKTTKIVENKYNNDFIVNSTAYEIELNNKSVTMSFNEIDLDLFTPNKEFYLDIKADKKEYRNINGCMKLSRVLAVYEKKDDSSFTGLITAEFKGA